MTKKLKFKTAYSEPVRVSFKTTGPSLTQQQYAEDSKIQNIMRKYDSTGFFDNINRNPGRYVDISDITDIRDAMDRINEANDHFMDLPSDIRQRFKNNPTEFYEFAMNPDNMDEMVRLGIANAPSYDEPEIEVNVPQKVSSTPVVEEPASKDA